MTGAARSPPRPAQRAGAGMVRLSSPGIDPAAPTEAVGRRLPAVDWDAAVLDDLDRFEALVIGPGLGRADHTGRRSCATVTGSLVPTVIDGDGLFAMSWNEAARRRSSATATVATVLTPHDGEYALLTGAAPGRDRIAAARQLASWPAAWCC